MYETLESRQVVTHHLQVWRKTYTGQCKPPQMSSALRSRTVAKIVWKCWRSLEGERMGGSMHVIMRLTGGLSAGRITNRKATSDSCWQYKVTNGFYTCWWPTWLHHRAWHQRTWTAHVTGCPQLRNYTFMQWTNYSASLSQLHVTIRPLLSWEVLKPWKFIYIILLRHTCDCRDPE